MLHRFCDVDVLEPWERRNHLDCMESVPEKEFLIFGEYYSHESDHRGFNDMRWLTGEKLLELFDEPVLNKALANYLGNIKNACLDLLGIEEEEEKD